MPNERATRILALLPRDESVSQLEPFLSRSSMEISRAESGDEAVSLASAHRFDLAIAHLPLPDMRAPELVRNLRRFGAPDREMQIIFIAQTVDLQAERLILTPSVRAVGLDEGEARLRHVISEALGVAARLDVRIPIRLEVGIESGRTLRYCETRNLSRSGLLITSNQPLPVGVEFTFDLMLPYSYVSLRGLASVVRHTSPTREHALGFGARFEELTRIDSVRIESFIRSRLSLPSFSPAPTEGNAGVSP